MAPKSATTHIRLARLSAISDLVTHTPFHADDFEHDPTERGKAFGAGKLAQSVKELLASKEATPKEKLKAVTYAVSQFPAEYSADPNDWESEEFDRAVERGEIAFAKQIRRILNSPL